MAQQEGVPPAGQRLQVLALAAAEQAQVVVQHAVQLEAGGAAPAGQAQGTRRERRAGVGVSAFRAAAAVGSQAPSGCRPSIAMTATSALEYDSGSHSGRGAQEKGAGGRHG